jgi:epoxyqueuosine reductase QueG
LPEKLTVISWILPIVEETRKSNRKENKAPSRLWCHTRWYGEKCNEALRRYIVDLLTGQGYLAVAPAIQSFFKVDRNEKGAFSNWSERHIAYAAGHGTFSLSDGLITERGMAHRCGSVVTSLVIPPSPRTARSPYSNCLHYLGIKCEKCVQRCPVGAISEKGHDKVKCSAYVDEILGYYKSLKEGYDNEKSSAGCGLCQTKTPCEFQNPAAKVKK